MTVEAIGSGTGIVRGAALRTIAWSGAVALAAWWATALTTLGLGAWMHPFSALCVGAACGGGAVTLLASGARPSLESLAPPRGAAWPAIVLLVGALGAADALQAATRAVLGLPAAPSLLSLPGSLVLQTWSAAPAAALVGLIVIVPIVQEALFRGVLLPRLVTRLGLVPGVAVVSLFSAAACVVLPGPPADYVPALVGSLLLAIVSCLVRVWTGSVLAAIAFRVGVAAAWAGGLLLGRPLEGAAGAVLGLVATAGGLAWLHRVRVRDGEPMRMTPAAAAQATSAAPGHSARRWTWPLAGGAVGIGFLVAECAVVVKGMLASFAGDGIARQVGLSLVAYVGMGACLDLAMQAVLPARWRHRAAVRALPALATGFVIQQQFGLFAIVALWMLPLAATWAWAAHVRWARPLAAALALFALTGRPASVGRTPSPTAQAVPAPRGAPSFIVVVLDTVRRDRMSLHGHSRKTTPHLDSLAARGVRFEGAYSSSCWSIPSHASLFTGLAARHHGAAWANVHLRDDVPVLAEALAAAGWETAGFSANPYITHATGFGRGFGTFRDLWRPWVMERSLAIVQMIGSMRSAGRDKGGAALVSELRDWLSRRDADRPFFAFVNLMEAHAPYQDAPHYDAFAPAAVPRARLRAAGRSAHDAQWLGSRVQASEIPLVFDLMDGATLSADAYLGRILELAGDDVTIVVLSDHGDLVGEHDLHGHMTSLHEPLIRVPLVMAGPGLPQGVVLDGPVSIIDVFPTILSLAGVPVPSCDGTDLSPALHGEPLPASRPLLAEHDRNRELALWAQHRDRSELAALMASKTAVVLAGRKRVLSEDGTDTGYDLVADPAEERPLPGADMGVIAVPPVGGEGAAPTGEMDPAQLEALRALGYVR